MSDLGRWLVIAGAIGQTAFALMYGFGTRWWRDPVGRALMVKAGGLALTLDLVTGFYIFGDYPGRSWASLAVFGLVVLGAYWQLIVFVKIRWQHRRSVEDRKAIQALTVSVDRLGVRADEGAASNRRIETAAAVVADDLEAAQARADEVTGEPGAAADAASQSPTPDEKS